MLYLQVHQLIVDVSFAYGRYINYVFFYVLCVQGFDKEFSLGAVQ